ncbi:glycosyltransferase family 4 protein [Haloarcula litorea]|uniref:glycosyltransferase family 4 protein n=1 Tax=Haloarcula litorea TaxID=3032579 RepID=UPI0023E78B20|nr:glycosyltransferase family 4 protein [Halomicroarcula sp. GDY20]
MYHAVISAANHPDPFNPYLGVFNYRSIKSLSETGVRTDVISPRPTAPPVGPYSEFGNIPAKYSYDTHEVHYPRFAYLLPQKLFKYTLSSWSISRMVPKFTEREFSTPDICHAGHIHYDGYALLPYCRDHNIPLTVMGRGKILNNYHTLSEISKRKVRETLDYADRILCVSESLAKIAEDILDEPKAVVLPNGANPSRYPTERKAQIRRELGVKPETTLILFCGGYTERKGIHEIRAGLDQIRHEDVQFVFVGHYGDLRTRLIEALETSSHEGYQVLWKVPPLALRRWFTAADIFILPSRAEGRPNTVYESMASETAVIASDVSGIPEQVVDGETGTLIPPEDPNALATAINNLINNREMQKRMGVNARERLVSEGWTWEAHAERLSSIHRSILEEGERPYPREEGERSSPNSPR